MSKNNRSSYSYFKYTASTFSIYAAGILFRLFTSIIINRLLGPENKGVLVLALLIPNLMINFMELGIGSATIYYISHYKQKIKEFLSNNLTLTIIISFLSIFISLATVVLLKPYLFEEVPFFYLYLAILITPTSLVFKYISNVFAGLQKIWISNILNFLNYFFLFILATALLFYKSTVVSALSAYIISAALVFLVASLTFKRQVGKYEIILKKDYSKKSFIYGIKIFSSNVLSYLNYRFDMFLLAIFLNPLAVGLYTAAVAIAEKLWLISYAASYVLFPTLTNEPDEQRKKRITPIVSRNVLLMTLVSSSVVFVLAKKIIIILFSKSFADSSTALQFLLPGILALSISRILSNDISARGRPIYNTYASVITVILNVIGNIVLIPLYGITGAAAASTLSYTAQTIFKIIIYLNLSDNRLIDIIIPRASDIDFYKSFFSLIFKKIRP